MLRYAPAPLLRGAHRRVYNNLQVERRNHYQNTIPDAEVCPSANAARLTQESERPATSLPKHSTAAALPAAR
jgi:hypothetical protein